MLVVFAFLGILVTFRLVWPEFPFPRQRRFTECDPHKVVNLIKESFDVTFPKSISSAKAAETRTSWLEHNYIFILSFTTNLKGWDQFHTSIPIDDPFQFEDYDTNSFDPRTNYCWGRPKWHKTKIRKGKYYVGYLYSKDQHLQIDTICADLADPEKVTVYVEGWGPYRPGYGLD